MWNNINVTYEEHDNTIACTISQDVNDIIREMVERLEREVTAQSLDRCELLLNRYGWFKQKEKPELKPCPFCGSEAKLESNEEEWGFAVSCSNVDCPVDASTYARPTAENAVEAWNTRAENTCM